MRFVLALLALLPLGACAIGLPDRAPPEEPTVAPAAG